MWSSNATGDIQISPDDISGVQDESPALVHAAMGILAFFSVGGIVGNALVLYVFSRQKQMPTSTIFILTLAATDFVSSLITMPFTITVELLKFQVEWDMICKLYHFLITSTIPFSAFVMVAIALDRYLCIVHPFKHTMTLVRAKLIVFVLAMIAVCIGLLCCLVYGVYKDGDDIVTLAFKGNGTEERNTFLNANETLFHNHTFFHNIRTQKVIVYNGKCLRNTILISDFTFKGIQMFYSSLFGVCAVFVIVLYISIYQRVSSRRQRLRIIGNRYCTCCISSSTVEHEQTEFSMLHNESNKVVEIGETTISEGNSLRIKKNSTETQGNNGVQPDADGDALVRSSGVSKAKLEKLRIANIKTALMLSVVALVFIFAFLPAWLMALKVVTMNVMVFYMYFLYNVANPVIYAFMNPNFRNQLKDIFERCR
ncbi:hypothetical protein ACJMK2_008238 [Sinanodonta woodiana]|uniref:G-protein coupled receptors family 1 profile domain-containing protein n=1 Tax=Sinanodonta woodiana TaxID=1069815 RepID=A0ABD3VM73_SINWO